MTGLSSEASIPTGTAPLESILRAKELHRRPSGPPNYEKENCALVKLVSALADSPTTVLQMLAETILDITRNADGVYRPRTQPAAVRHCHNASTCMRMPAADPPNVEGARETVPQKIRDGNRASERITRLGALFSKKSATTQSIDLNEATREIIALSLSELQRDRVIDQQELADGLPLVAGDHLRLHQVILNLLRNASDAMSAVDDRRGSC